MALVRPSELNLMRVRTQGRFPSGQEQEANACEQCGRWRGLILPPLHNCKPALPVNGQSDWSTEDVTDKRAEFFFQDPPQSQMLPTRTCATQPCHIVRWVRGLTGSYSRGGGANPRDQDPGGDSSMNPRSTHFARQTTEDLRNSGKWSRFMVQRRRLTG